MSSLFICWNCGEKVEPGYCRNCGVEIKDPNVIEVEPKSLDKIQRPKGFDVFEKPNNDINTIIYLLLFLNVGFYIYTSILSGGVNLSDTLWDRFGASSFAIAEGRYYVLLTAMFTHGDFLHIFFNMYWVIFLANRLAGMGYSNRGILGSYMLIGLVESYVTTLIDPYSLSVGASAAVFGLMGMYLAILRRRDDIRWKRYLQFIGIYMLISLIVPYISFWGHFIGFLLGWIIGAVKGFDYFKKK